MMKEVNKYLLETRRHQAYPMLISQSIYRFPNGHGASVVVGPYTTGGSMYELAETIYHGADMYDWAFKDDVEGIRSDEGLYKRLKEIMNQ